MKEEIKDLEKLLLMIEATDKTKEFFMNLVLSYLGLDVKRNFALGIRSAQELKKTLEIELKRQLMLITEAGDIRELRSFIASHKNLTSYFPEKYLSSLK